MTQARSKKSILSSAVQTAIDQWLVRYPADRKRSAVIEALRLTQEENGGYLTETLLDAVADYLDCPPIAVYEVATFYSMFNLKPVGKHVISVCTNISCMLGGCGSSAITSHLKKQLGIDFNETTSDGKFTLREVECLAACVHAPAMQIGKRYYENLTPEKVDVILKTLE